MPALCAAIGSFHVKSATTYFVMVLMTVRVLPFLLTVVLIRSVTLFVSTLGVRSYSDQRYSSMQISSTRHSSNISTGRAAGSRYSVSGRRSNVNRDTTRTGVSSGGAGRGSGKGASTMGTSGADTPARTKLDSGGARTTVAAASAGGTDPGASEMSDDTRSADALSSMNTAAPVTMGAVALRGDGTVSAS